MIFFAFDNVCTGSGQNIMHRIKLPDTGAKIVTGITGFPAYTDGIVAGPFPVI